MTAPALLFLVDDDQQFCDLLRPFLVSYGYDLMIAHHGWMAWQMLQEELPDLVILDIEMPVMDGFQFCRKLRRDPRTASLPVLFLTIRKRIEDKCRAYSLEADDYLSKPFEPLELQCRIAAVLNRTGRRQRSRRPEISLDPENRVCWVPKKSEPIQLTEQETAVLAYLLAHSYQPVSAGTLMFQILGYPRGSMGTTSVRNLMQRLRRKLEPVPSRPRFIRTVYRYGYMLATRGEEVPDNGRAKELSPRHLAVPIPLK